MPSCPSPSWSCRWSWSSAGPERDGGVGSSPRRRQRFGSSSVARRSPSSSWSRAWSRAWPHCWPQPVAPGAGAAATLDVAETPPLVGVLLIGVTGDSLPRDRPRRPRLAPDADVLREPWGGSHAGPVRRRRGPEPPKSPMRRACSRASSASALPLGGRRTGWHDRCAPTPGRPASSIAIAFGVVLSTWHSLVEGVPSLSAAMVIVPVYAGLGAALVVGAYATVGRYLELIRHEAA